MKPGLRSTDDKRFRRAQVKPSGRKGTVLRRLKLAAKAVVLGTLVGARRLAIGHAAHRIAGAARLEYRRPRQRPAVAGRSAGAAGRPARPEHPVGRPRRLADAADALAVGRGGAGAPRAAQHLRRGGPRAGADGHRPARPRTLPGRSARRGDRRIRPVLSRPRPAGDRRPGLAAAARHPAGRRAAHGAGRPPARRRRRPRAPGRAGCRRSTFATRTTRWCCSTATR